MNPELRDKLFKVLSKPERVDMLFWGDTSACGTVGCIAGWTLMLLGCKPDGNGFLLRPNGVPISDVSAEARDVLGLSPEAGLKLFYGWSISASYDSQDGAPLLWPEDLKDRYAAGDKTSVLEALERALEGTL